MIQMIWKKTEPKLLWVFVQNRSRIKQFYYPELSDIDEAPFKWFEQDKNDSVTMRGPLLLISFALPKL